MLDEERIQTELKTAAERIRHDAQQLVELTRHKEAALLVLDLVCDGHLDPHDVHEKMATLLVADNFELEKRAIELGSQTQISSAFGELEDSSGKFAEDDDDEAASPEGKLVRNLRYINGLA